MILTIFGMVQLAIGLLIVIAGRLRHAFILLMLSGLFGGSAAVLLPALGGSSIPPAQFAMIFVVLRIVVPRGGFMGTIPEAIDRNKWLLAFTAYGVALAFIGPRLFQGQIDVFPMSNQDSRGMFDTYPLAPTSQNITAATYFIGSSVAALAAYIACRFRDGERALISAAIWIAWLHVATGLAAIATRGTPADAVFEFFRNGNYAQMDDVTGNFVRIRGIWPETSAYTSFAFSYFVLLAELWYKSIRPRATGLAAIALLLVLFFSTSSTAYIGILGYIAFFALRATALPSLVNGRKITAALKVGFLFVFLGAIMLIVLPALTEAISEMLVKVTVGKSDSSSADQRLFWAGQGWRVLFESYGIGIGPGSFRSSSIVTAMLGSVGVIGFAAFLIYLYQVVQPLRRSTYGFSGNPEADLAGALGTAALLILIPQAVNSPGALPSVEFAIFAGAALGLRVKGYLADLSIAAGEDNVAAEPYGAENVVEFPYSPGRRPPRPA